MCSSGGEDYDSRSADCDTVGPASLNGTETQFGSFFSLISQSHQQKHNFFDPSPNYLHALSQSQPAASIPNSEPNCTHLPDPPFSSSLFSGNRSVGGCRGEAARGEAAQQHDNAVRNTKKRSRASRRAPTTIITTDTSNFRSMVREFTGIPAPPSSAASHSRRFHPFRHSPRYLHSPNPSLPLSSSLNINTTTNVPSENVVDPIAPTITTHNAPASHQLLPDLGFAFQTPLHLPLPTTLSSKSQPSGSEWPVNATNSWPSHL